MSREKVARWLNDWRFGRCTDAQWEATKETVLPKADELLSLLGDGEPVACTCTIEREGHGEATHNWLFKHCKAHGHLSEEEYKKWRWQSYLHQLRPDKEPKPPDPGIYLHPQREPGEDPILAYLELARKNAEECGFDGMDILAGLDEMIEHRKEFGLRTDVVCVCDHMEGDVEHHVPPHTIPNPDCLAHPPQREEGGEERRLWIATLAEAVAMGSLTVSQEACVLASVNGYSGSPNILDEEYYASQVCGARKTFGLDTPSAHPQREPGGVVAWLIKNSADGHMFLAFNDDDTWGARARKPHPDDGFEYTALTVAQPGWEVTDEEVAHNLAGLKAAAGMGEDPGPPPGDGPAQREPGERAKLKTNGLDEIHDWVALQQCTQWEQEEWEELERAEATACEECGEDSFPCACPDAAQSEPGDV